MTPGVVQGDWKYSQGTESDLGDQKLNLGTWNGVGMTPDNLMLLEVTSKNWDWGFAEFRMTAS